MPIVLNAEDFIDKFESEKILLLDVRSEKEFDHAHVPYAVNIPVLNNEHRHLVGIEYKKMGREAAVVLGFKLAGPFFHEFITRASQLCSNREVMIYCWRGGMRSSIMAWILSMAGFRVSILKGGYKSFRSFILGQFLNEKKIIIIGGHTGSGKTEILSEMKKMGEQVIDLEDLANHRGSAFGRLGLKPQPSNEYFENQLGLLWRKIEADKTVWLEAESHTIGQIKIPDDIFNQLQNAPLVEVLCSHAFRKQRILSEYGSFPKKDLAECTSKLSKRLGQLRLSEALYALNDDRYDVWVDILMEYYDKTYAHSLNERNSITKVTLMLNENEKLQDFGHRIKL